jgi:hypothetical protein
MMPHLRRTRSSAALLLAALSILQAQAPRPVDSDALVRKIQGELSDPFPPDEGKPDASIPHGEFLQGQIADSKIYPGTENGFVVYVPAQYDPARPACLLVKVDGLGAYEGTVVLYVTDGRQVFTRRLKVPGFAPWAPPVAVPSQGAG